VALSQAEGLATTHSDPQGRPTVFEALPEERRASSPLAA
jgi:hypothetical protein